MLQPPLTVKLKNGSVSSVFLPRQLSNNIESESTDAISRTLDGILSHPVPSVSDIQGLVKVIGVSKPVL